MEQKFIDGVQDVSITNGMVRVNCFGMVGPSPDGEGKVRVQPSTQLVLTPDTFMRFYDTLTRFHEELKERGMIRPTGDGQTEEVSQ